MDYLIKHGLFLGSLTHWDKQIKEYVNVPFLMQQESLSKKDSYINALPIQKRYSISKEVLDQFIHIQTITNDLHQTNLEEKIKQKHAAKSNQIKKKKDENGKKWKENKKDNQKPQNSTLNKITKQPDDT